MEIYFLLQALNQNMPDGYFWYTLSMLLAGVIVWVVIRYLNQQQQFYKKVEARFEKNDEKFDKINIEVLDSKKNLALHGQALELLMNEFKRK
jgi:uncharacterized membrane-anchored protein YhcB (DUF1043 family)